MAIKKIYADQPLKAVEVDLNSYVLGIHRGGKDFFRLQLPSDPHRLSPTYTITSLMISKGQLQDLRDAITLMLDAN